MGVIQSGINQAIQTAAIIGQLQEVPQKRKTIQTTSARIDEINEAHEQYQKDLKKEYETKVLDKEGKEIPYQKEKFNEKIKQALPLVQAQIDERKELSDQYQKSGGKEEYYKQYHPSEADKIKEILEDKAIERTEEEGLYQDAARILKPIDRYKGRYDEETYKKALELAEKQRETYGYVNKFLKQNIAKYTEGYNGK